MKLQDLKLSKEQIFDVKSQNLILDRFQKPGTIKRGEYNEDYILALGYDLAEKFRRDRNFKKMDDILRLREEKEYHSIIKYINVFQYKTEDAFYKYQDTGLFHAYVSYVDDKNICREKNLSMKKGSLCLINSRKEKHLLAFFSLEEMIDFCLKNKDEIRNLTLGKGRLSFCKKTINKFKQFSFITYSGINFQKKFNEYDIKEVFISKLHIERNQSYFKIKDELRKFIPDEKLIQKEIDKIIIIESEYSKFRVIESYFDNKEVIFDTGILLSKKASDMISQIEEK